MQMLRALPWPGTTTWGSAVLGGGFSRNALRVRTCVCTCVCPLNQAPIREVGRLCEREGRAEPRNLADPGES